MSPRRILRALTALSAISASTFVMQSRTARADDASDLEGLLDESVVTTASKSAETATTAPATSTTITAEDIRRYGIHSIDEAINYLALGMFVTNPLRDGEVGARGVILSGDWNNHVLLLVNGHAMNERLRGAAYFDHGSGIPIEMVDHIEVILGPGSVLYGSNAMLGVVNVITKRAKDMQGVSAVAESELGKSYRANAGIGTTFELLKMPAELTLMVEYYSQKGPTFHYGPQNVGDDPNFHTPQRFGPNWATPGVWGGDVKNAYYSRVPSGVLQFRLGDLELNVMASTNTRGTPYFSRYWSPFTDFDDPMDGYVDRSLRGDLRYHKALSSVVSLSSRVYGDLTDQTTTLRTTSVSACLYPNASPTCLYTSDYASRWAGWENQLSLDWFKDARFITLVGGDARYNWVGTKSDAQDAVSLRYLASSYAVTRHQDAILGAYVQQTWDPTAHVGVNAGARIDASSTTRAAFSPRIAGRYEAWPNGTLKVIYAEAFRAPTVIETEFVGDLTLGDKNIHPESVRSIEGLIEQRFGAQRLLFGAFRSWWRDLIAVHTLTAQEEQQIQQEQHISIRSSDVVQFRNVSSIDNFGFNAAFEGSLVATRLRYGLNVTGAVAHQQDEGGTTSPLPVAPRLYGNARVSYNLGGAWPTLAVAANAVSPRLADRALDGHYPSLPYSPTQLELRGTVSGDVPFVRGLSYRGSINWAAADRIPYVVGPAQSYLEYPLPAELAPVDTLRITVGLSYRFGN